MALPGPQLPSWVPPEWTQYDDTFATVPSLDEDPFMAWAAQQRQERETPILPDPTDTPVPDVAFEPIEFPLDPADTPEARGSRDRMRAILAGIPPADPRLAALFDDPTQAPMSEDEAAARIRQAEAENVGTVDNNAPTRPDPFGLKVEGMSDGGQAEAPVGFDAGHVPVKIGRPRPIDDRAPIDPYSGLIDPYAEDDDPGLFDRAFGKVTDVAADAAPADADGDRLVDTLGDDKETAAQADEAEIQRLASDPEALRRLKIDQSLAKQAEDARLRLEAEVKAKGDLENEIRIRDEAQAKTKADRVAIEQEAKALADGSPFERWWSSKSAGSQILGLIAAFAGGIMQGMRGGGNVALDLMMKVADDDAAQKWRSIQSRREMNGEAMADADENFRLRSSLIAASREQALRMAEATLANYDPKGTHYIATAEMIANGRAAEAQRKAQEDEARRKATEEALKTHDLIRKTDIEEAKYNLDAAKALDDSTLKWAEFKRKATAGAGGGRGLFNKTARYTAAEWGQLVPGLDVSKLPANIPLTYDEMDKVVTAQGKINQQGVDKARGVGIGQENEERTAKATIFDPRRPDVIVGVVKDPKFAEKIKTSLPNTVQAVEVLDEMIRIIDEEGGASDIFKNPNWQRLTSDEAVVGNLVRVSQHMGAYDAGVATLAKDMRGGVDTKSFVRDAKPGLRNLRAKLVRGSELELGQAGLKPYEFPDLSKPTAPKKSETASRLMARKRGGLLAPDITVGPDGKVEALPGYDKAALDIATAAIERGGDDADQQAADVAEAAANAPNPVAQVAAAAELWRLRRAGNPAAIKAFKALDRARQATIQTKLSQEDRDAALLDLVRGEGR